MECETQAAALPGAVAPPQLLMRSEPHPSRHVRPSPGLTAHGKREGGGFDADLA
ncbi:MAG TPA: hypothetical protein VLT62_20805 [Candidatus Methylomirabilis sp.]|nr:hypothetical protein [Candidatus Methylomirabilis sp.]